MLGPDGALDEFWSGIGHMPWARGNANSKTRPIPILVHADGAQIYRDSEYYVWSVSSASVVSTHLDVVDCKFQILKIPAIQMKDFTDDANLGSIGQSFSGSVFFSRPQSTLFEQPLQKLAKRV